GARRAENGLHDLRRQHRPGRPGQRRRVRSALRGAGPGLPLHGGPEPERRSRVCSGPATGYRLVLVKLPNGKPITLTPNHPESFVSRFTPDGRTIVFFRRDGDVYSIAADGTTLRRLTRGNAYVEFKLSDKDQHGSSDGPDISPDGKRIAYLTVKG